MPYSTLRKRYYPSLREEPDRFWRRVQIGSEDECWPWLGAISTSGYGRAGKQGYAHRLAYELTIGPIGPGRFVLHRCDSPRCCNPSHLFLGDARDNARDMAAKGRVGGGGPRRFDRSVACQLLAEGHTLREVARELGVSHSSLHKALRPVTGSGTPADWGDGLSYGPGIPETGHWQTMRVRAETTLSYEGRADCLDHAKGHARDVLVLAAERERLRAALTRATHIAEHLFQMIDRETWLATGGDDGQGHYEGDYRAEQTCAEIQQLAALGEADDE